MPLGRGYGSTPSTASGGARGFFSEESIQRRQDDQYEALRKKRGPLGSLEDILEERFLPRYEEVSGQRRSAEQAYQDRLSEGVDYGSALEQLQPEVEGMIAEMFGAGGQVEQLSSQALRATTDTGFGPRSGAFDRARSGILRGARGEVTNRVAQRASELAPLGLREFESELGSLQQDVTETRGAEMGLLESLFGGAGTVEQLGLSKDTADLNRQIVEAQLDQLRSQQEGGGFGGFLKSLLGGAASAATGGIAGGIASGLFGGTEDIVSGIFGGNDDYGLSTDRRGRSGFGY